MQSGVIKHWNTEKGYGFIDVDNQNEDVFFHISTARLPQPITEGQRVYFNSERNDKNQLRATEVTPFSLSIEERSGSERAKQTSNRTNQNNHSRHTQNNRGYNNSPPRSNQNKRSLRSTLFSLIALIAVAVYFFGDLQSGFLSDSIDSSSSHSRSQTTSEVSQSNSRSSNITGDAQVDNTIALIQQGGPFPYPHKDGTTFYNREGRLPAASQGYYREYTVPTPGVSHRGARRIVTGGNPPTVYYLTVDHYDSFRKLEVK